MVAPRLPGSIGTPEHKITHWVYVPCWCPKGAEDCDMTRYIADMKYLKGLLMKCLAKQGQR